MSLSQRGPGQMAHFGSYQSFPKFFFSLLSTIYCIVYHLLNFFFYQVLLYSHLTKNELRIPARKNSVEKKIRTKSVMP